MAHTQRFTQN